MSIQTPRLKTHIFIFRMFVYNMKQIIHKIISLSLAFVVLVSTMSFTVNMHYCGDNLVDTAIFVEAETCGMEMDTTATDCSVKKKNCCTKKQVIVEGQDELKISFDTLSLNQQYIISSFVYTFAQPVEILDESPLVFNNTSPPKVVRQRFKIDESYLI